MAKQSLPIQNWQLPLYRLTAANVHIHIDQHFDEMICHVHYCVFEATFLLNPRTNELKEHNSSTKPENDLAGSVYPIFLRLPICSFTSHNHNNCTLLQQPRKKSVSFLSVYVLSVFHSLCLFNVQFSVWFNFSFKQSYYSNLKLIILIGLWLLQLVEAPNHSYTNRQTLWIQEIA